MQETVGNKSSIPGSGRSPEEEWQLTPVFLPGEFHGQRSLAAYSPWDHKELETTERLSLIDKNNPKALGSTQNVKK